MDSRSIVQYLGGPAKGPGIDVAGAAADARGGGILCPGSLGAATVFAPRAGTRRAIVDAAPFGVGAADDSAGGTVTAVALLAALLSAGTRGVSVTGVGAGALGDTSGAPGAGALDDRSGTAGAGVAVASTGPDGASRGTNSQ
ncbi:hypothetical protein [Sorangium sp. So ce117]|uniref:hypothetical protein n=1 Tax=Sorangium sp. So ce117 TaxID=3133277 RepID=UPI003F5EB791